MSETLVSGSGPPGERVLVAMSGGVDSSVAAALLVEAGYHVTGVTMKLWGGPSDQGCCSVADVDDARRVADQLGIEHHVFNFSDDFEANVVEPYVEAHAVGETPNPCIECNRHLKFDRLVRRARAVGFATIATGHHARVVAPADGIGYRIARGADVAKDQSYVLYMLGQEVLSGLLLPLGSMTKDTVRAHARRLGLRTAQKPDSQDVCFIGSDTGRNGFLTGRIPLTPARLVDSDGEVVGTVPSVQLVTIGQRKGLGLAGGSNPRYVTGIDATTSTVYVGPAAALLATTMRVRSLEWAEAPVKGPILVQTSAHGVPRGATLDGDMLTWDQPVRRVASGQSVVFYDGDLVCGGGIALAAPS